MNINYIVTPVAGAVIGYFTNWLAIKMLFRPHTQKYFFGVKIPFTPGLIPKEKERIAKTLGDTVGNHLLTNEVLIDSLGKTSVIESIALVLDSNLIQAKQSQLTINQLLEKVLDSSKGQSVEKIKDLAHCKLEGFVLKPAFISAVSDALYSQVSTVLNKNIEDFPMDKFKTILKSALMNTNKNAVENIIEKNLWAFLLGLKEDERKLSDIATYSTVQEIKDYLSLKTPTIVNSLLSLTEKPEVEQLLKAKIASIVQGFAGPFMGMFINSDDVYVSLIEKITTYINDPENTTEIDSVVSLIVDNAMNLSLGDAAAIVTGEMREASVNKAVSFCSTEFFKESNIDKLVNNLENFIKTSDAKTPMEMLEGIDKKSDDKLRSLVNKITDNLLCKGSVSHVWQIVEGKINDVLNKKISDILTYLPPAYFETFKNSVTLVYKRLLPTVAPKILIAFNVPEIVENQINSFRTQYTEELILNIVNKELKSITAIGGILGFIIGLLPVLMEFL